MMNIKKCILVKNYRTI